MGIATRRTLLRRALRAAPTMLVLAWSAATQAAPQARPMRIVSLNLCTDQIVIDLVPRSRIRALSLLAMDETVSPILRQAQGLPLVHGEAEEVLRLDPDLVLAGAHSTPATVALLERLGRRVVKVPLAHDLDGVRAAVRQIAAAVGEPARGEAMIRDLDVALAQVRPRPGARRPTALIYQVNGIVSGPSSLADAALKAAGLRTLADDLRLGAGGRAPLETIVAHPPDLIVLSGPPGEYRTAVADNLSHPALRAIMRRHMSLVVPWRYWLCGTPRIAEAVAQLAAARDRLLMEAHR